MSYYNAKQSLSAKGMFIGYLEGYATFHLVNDEIIDFEEVHKRVSEVYNLKNNEFKNRLFQIYYSEVFDDLSKDEFFFYKLEELILL